VTIVQKIRQGALTAMFAAVSSVAVGSSDVHQQFRVERSGSHFSRGLAEHEFRGIAQQLEEGLFWVRAAYITERDSLVEGPRVLYFYSSLENLKELEPVRRIFVRKSAVRSWISAGNDTQLLDAYWQSLPQDGLDDKSVRNYAPQAVSAVLYEGRAVFLKSEWRKFANKELDAVRDCGEVRRAEFRELVSDSVVVRDRARKLINWKGRFLLDTGALEEVSLSISESGDGTEVRRLLLKPVGYFPVVQRSGFAAEEWVVKPR
jgi:hypothetical protein